MESTALVPYTPPAAVAALPPVDVYVPAVTTNTGILAASIGRKALLAAVTQAATVIERRNTIPILSNIKLSSCSDMVAVEGTDLDATVRVTVPAIVDCRPWTTTVPAHILQDVLKKSAAESVDLILSTELTKKGDKVLSTVESVKVKLGGVTVTLQPLPSTDFPIMADASMKAGFTLPATALLAAMDDVEFAISTEETRYYLNGVYLEARRPTRGSPVAIRATSTDGHRLASRDLPVTLDGRAWGAAIKGKGVIVPRATLAAMAKVFKAAKAKKGEHSTPQVSVAIGKERIRFASGGITLTSKLVDGTFPDYARVIPAGNDKVATIDADALVAAISSVSTIRSERGPAVKFSLKPGELTLSVSNPDSGGAVTTVACDYTGDDFVTGFNSRFVLDILAHFAGQAVTLRLADPGSPALICAAARPELLTVLMPMRV